MAMTEASDAAPAGPRVVVVDADRRVQQSLADLLQVSGNVQVVGSAGDVRAALELVQATAPDIVIVDPRLPDVQAGAALLSSVRLAWPGITVVLTGWTDDREQATAGMSYVSKSAAPEEFVNAVLAACGCAPVD